MQIIQYLSSDKKTSIQLSKPFKNDFEAMQEIAKMLGFELTSKEINKDVMDLFKGELEILYVQDDFELNFEFRPYMEKCVPIEFPHEILSF